MEELGLCFGVLPGVLGIIFALLARSKATQAMYEVEQTRQRLGRAEASLRDLRAAMLASQRVQSEAATEATSSREKADQPQTPAPAPAPSPASTTAPSPIVTVIEPPVRPEGTEQQPAPAPAPVPSVPEVVSSAPSLSARAAEFFGEGEPSTPRGPAAKPSVSAPRAAPPPVAAPIEWEKWIGVRGAAVLGGIVFALAGVYLFRYSISQGWISPGVRVVMATLAGLASLVASQRLRQKYEVTSNALGAGAIVVLYAGFWAARVMYHLIPSSLAFLLMVLTTAVAGLLAVKQGNRLAAYLGLLGGFCTPLLLSTGQNAPIPLFSYIFMLDLGLLTVAYLRRWGSVAALALGGTVLMQAGWVFTRMESSDTGVAFVVLALFAALFGLFAARFQVDDSKRGSFRAMQTAALLTPTVFLTYFAASSALHVPLLALAAFLTVLTLGVGFVHRKRPQGEGLLLHLATAAQVIVMGTAIAARPEAELASWTLVGGLLALVAATHLNLEWQSTRQHVLDAFSPAAAATGLGWLLLELAWFRAIDSHEAVPFVVANLVLGLGFMRLLHRAEQHLWQSAVGAALALGLWAPRAWAAMHLNSTLEVMWSFGPLAVAAVAWLGFATWTKKRQSDFSTVTLVAVGLGLSVLHLEMPSGAPLERLIAQVLLSFIGVAAALRAKSPASALAVCVVAGLCVLTPGPTASGEVMPWRTFFAIGLGAAVVLHAMILSAGRSFFEKPWSAVASSAVLPLMFLGLLGAWRGAWSPEFQGALPAVLAVVSLASAALARKAALPRAVMVWHIASALGFISVAVPLQLENEWWTVSWAVMSAAFLLLWKRLDHQGLKWLALTLLAVVATRLLLNPEVLHYHQRGGFPFFNWLAYTYLIPAACLGAAAWLLGKDELARVRGWETSLYSAKIPLGASASAISCALIVFAYLTLAVFDAFETGTQLTLSSDRLPARDLTLSLTWLAYSGTLLAIGMWRTSRSMRWVSLIFMLVSIGKVFLYDLGELGDLYRVASLMGLAISLIVISLAYQRFVFRRPEGVS